MESPVLPPSPPTQASSSLPQPGGESLMLPPGTAEIRLCVDVPPGVQIRMEIETRSAGGQSLGSRSLELGTPSAPALPVPKVPAGPLIPRLRAAYHSASVQTLAAWLTWLALGVYTLTRLVGLPDFPIYFFTDEAVQTISAADLLRDGLEGPAGEFLPTFFQNGSQYNLSTSVYLQALPYFFFGKSIWVTRGTAALATLLAAFSISVILKRIFKIPYPWLGVMFLSITPAWFLHSRTAFETSLAVSFYAAFLCCYLLYRFENPRWLYGAVAVGALTFYSYSSARFVILVSALLLFLTDAVYHWRSRGVVLRAFGLALLAALPFVRFLYNHPEATAWQMRLLGSYWITDIPLSEKLLRYAGEYLHGLSPLYWYLPHDWDLPRHTMLDYGHLLRPTLPLMLVGLALALRGAFRGPTPAERSAARVLLIAVLAAPAGAAVVRLGVTRALVMVIPAALLTALGASVLMDWLQTRRGFSQKAVSAAVFLALLLVNLYVLGDSLIRGPLWFHDYSLNGMQYGARQLFGEVAETLRQDPQAKLVVSPSWANGTDVVARFFFRDPLPFELNSAEAYYNEGLPIDENTLFVLIPEEYNRLPRTRLSRVQIEKTILYPDGRPGFYFVRLSYVDNLAEVIAAEKQERLAPETGQVDLLGTPALVRHSKLDIGGLEQIFDANPDSMVRTWAINPMLLDIDFPSPRPLDSLTFRIGGTATTFNVQIYRPDQSNPLELTRVVEEAPLPRDIVFDGLGGIMAERVVIEVRNTNDPPEGHVHLWEASLK